MRTLKMPLKKAWRFLDRTGYPFAFGMKVVHGRKMCLIGSADHRPRLASGGNGFVKSRAVEIVVARQSKRRRQVLGRPVTYSDSDGENNHISIE